VEVLNEKTEKVKFRKSVKFPYYVLAFSLILTIGATYLFYQSAKSKDTTRFTTSVNRIRSAMENRIGLYVALLKSGRGFIESSNDLDHNKYTDFIQSLELEKNYHGAQGIGFTKTVRSEELAEFIDSRKREGMTSYRVYPATENTIHQPVVYLEPADERNQKVIGFDMASEITRSTAMDRARDTGMASTTSRLNLLQETTPDRQYGFLIYLPIYKAASSLTTIEDRQQNLQGFIYSPFRAKNFLKDVQENAGTSDIVITLYDGAPGEENFLAQTETADGVNLTQQIAGSFSTLNELEVGGRRWTIKYDSLPAFAFQSSVNWTPLIFLCGLIFSLLLFGMTYWESATRSKLEATTGELTESERQIQGLLEKEQAARRLAEAANATKDEFISVVSHELRTPLNAIAGWTRILKSDDLSASTKELALQKIEKNLRLQTKLVEDLLSFSQLVSSRESLEKTEVDCAEIFENVYAEFEQVAIKKGIKISRENDLNGQTILGDPEQIKIVIINLLSNALKFTPRDGAIKARLHGNDDCIELKIEDSGSGIKAEFLPHIFDRFSQYDTSTTSKFGGLGLGLAVTEHIVKLHNGSIEAKSEGEGKGSTFSVKLPVFVP